MTSTEAATRTTTRPRLAYRLWRIFRLLLVGYLLLLLAMTFLERYLIYPAPPVSVGDWNPVGFDYEDVFIEQPDGVTLHGWFFPREGAKRTLLYLHGNGENVSFKPHLMKQLGERLDTAVLEIDYRGYGKSTGKPFERGVIDDGLAAQRWLAKRTGRRPDEVTLLGRSLGGGVAVACAAELGAEALILQSTFSRLTDAAAHHYPWLPVRLLMQNRYDSVARIQQYRGPVFVSHGVSDRVVPFEQGRRLFEASPSAVKQFFEIPDRGHNEPQPRGYYEALVAFLEAVDSDSEPHLAPGQ